MELIALKEILGQGVSITIKLNDSRKWASLSWGPQSLPMWFRTASPGKFRFKNGLDSTMWLIHRRGVIELGDIYNAL